MILPFDEKEYHHTIVQLFSVCVCVYCDSYSEKDLFIILLFIAYFVSVAIQAGHIVHFKIGLRLPRTTASDLARPIANPA